MDIDLPSSIQFLRPTCWGKDFPMLKLFGVPKRMASCFGFGPSDCSFDWVVGGILLPLWILAKEAFQMIQEFMLRFSYFDRKSKSQSMFSKLMFVSAILFLLSANLFAQVSDQPITLETGTGKIEGTLLRPETAEKVPIVLIIAGSGPTDRNGNNPSMVNNSLKMLAEGFAQNGIASVRYDKRGVGESKNAALSESELRFENYVEDAVSWVELLGKDIRFSEIIVLGHSEGSLVGMIAAQRAKVDKFISVAGVGSPAGDIIREQLKAQPPFVLEQSLPIIEKLEKGETVADVPAMFFSLFRPSVQPYIISWFKYDPQQELAKLAQPILIIQGTTDIQVGVSDAEKLAKANSKAELHIIEGMNHILKEAESDRAKNIATYAMPNLPLKEGLIEVLLGFIQ